MNWLMKKLGYVPKSDVEALEKHLAFCQEQRASMSAEVAYAEEQLAVATRNLAGFQNAKKPKLGHKNQRYIDVAEEAVKTAIGTFA